MASSTFGSRMSTSEQALRPSRLRSWRSQDPNRRRGRVAVVAADDATFDIARMYAAYREKVGITVEVFRRIEEAESWLKGHADERGSKATHIV